MGREKVKNCHNCDFLDRGIEEDQYPYCCLLQQEISREEWRKCGHIFPDCPKV